MKKKIDDIICIKEIVMADGVAKPFTAGLSIISELVRKQSQSRALL